MIKALHTILSMSCAQATLLAEKRQVASLTVAERIGCRVHLLYCHICRLYIRQVAMIERIAKSWGQQESTDTMSQSRKETITHLIEQQLKS